MLKRNGLGDIPSCTKLDNQPDEADSMRHLGQAASFQRIGYSVP